MIRIRSRLLRGSRTQARVGAALLALSLALAACGGEDASTAGTSANSVPADVEQDVAAAKEPPTNVGTTDALPERPPTGKTIVAMACAGIPPCELYLSQFEEAAAALGWKAVTVQFEPTPEDILNKMRHAISLHPDGIVINGVSRATFANALDGVKIPVIQQDINDEPSPPVIAVQNGTEAFQAFGQLLGKWAVVDSEGSAKALLFTYANFPIGQTLINAAADEIEKDCGACTADVVVVQAADTGTALPGRIVSELQRNPDVDYVLLQDGGMSSGLQAALRGAGLEDRVKVAGAIPDAQSLEDLADGEQAAYVNLPLGQQAWQAMDGFARHFLEVEQPDWTIPAQILTKDGDYTVENGHVEPEGFQDKFRGLWKVS